MWVVLISIITIVFISKWGKERIKLLALAYYIVDKEYDYPTEEEMTRCIDEVIKHMKNDICKK